MASSIESPLEGEFSNFRFIGGFSITSITAEGGFIKITNEALHEPKGLTEKLGVITGVCT
ncbi:MAG: hypothetical protein OM95_16375 [Bdellovibrio sp. ArHS]|uniref:hypothetical protein n=1 Tax=Bdellovibrio sp. ArHS TaxID=1569284 RepID=UPI00058301AD|nr:hypothetical protein [Bdellovibrio sp. ArHS]KHD87086.1 MAG: hypothetical protein OM95_16375 [Bdellovibrio sp. ArHS]